MSEQHAPTSAEIQDLTVQFPYLQGLNPEQCQAVIQLEGPTLVLAGAGTGKTRALTTRLGHILRTNAAYPSQILAVTFTNKAALEMKERVAEMVNLPVDGWWLGTFHAIAARMLRQHAELVGLSNNFTILDTDDQARLVKQLCENANIDTKKWPPKAILSFFSKWKDRARTPDMVEPSEAGHLADGKIPMLYQQYQQRLITLNACDFDDLLMHMINIFKNPQHAEVLAKYQDRFKYILVDEYQDTNTAQYLWLRLLAQKNKNICCVGDDDQSIYGWRGAEVENILKFEKDFPNAQIIRLEQNYRSTKNILGAANGVIANNTNRLGKELWSDHETGDPVQVTGTWDGRQESQKVNEEIEALQRQKVPLNDMAVLVRAGFQTREFEERFIHTGTPYRVIGGPRFYERQEIRDALAYFRLVMQPHDDLAFERIIGKPRRGVGPAAIKTLYDVARAKNISLTDAIMHLTQTDELKPKMRATLMKFMDDLHLWRDALAKETHTNVAQDILTESGYLKMWEDKKSTDVEAAGRLENLKELISAMDEFENMSVFLEHVSLVMENQNSDSTDLVTIMTMHGAKGLEFDYVFLPGWEEGIFPSQRSLDENGIKGLEEERRLAYVGITRARKKAWIYHASSRYMYGQTVTSLPSRFIQELPDNHIEIQAETGLFGNNSGSGFGGGSSFGASNRHSGSDYQKRPAGRTAELRPASQLPSAGGHIKSSGGFAVGGRVYHKKFGLGNILVIDGDKLDIRFDTKGRKKVLDSFVEKAD